MNESAANDVVPVSPPLSHAEGLALQARLLPGVSRTFALTIPELPEGLRTVVTNGYLLCRIADTIEDEPALTLREKQEFHARFSDAVRGKADALQFAADLHPRLTDRTIPAERELIRKAGSVLAVTRAFEAPKRSALERCASVMCEGMARFQESREPRGLRDVAELKDYCYVVAGVVGEMLTSLFCDYSPEIAAQRSRLEALSVSFGQGLQLTNILKDIWDDLEHGYCWLPRDVFRAKGVDLDELRAGSFVPGFGQALGELLAIAHGNLKDALEYTLLIPGKELGIRRFCLWAVGMAVLTLKKIERRRDFAAAREVKISRSSVKATVVACNLATRFDFLLRWLFAWCSSGLPRPPVAA